MRDQVEAVYQNGVFKPLEPVELPEMQQVTVQFKKASQKAREVDPPTNADDMATEEEEVEPIWRGVFVVKTEDKQLFDPATQINIGDWGKLETKVTINPRWFEDDEDDEVV